MDHAVFLRPLNVPYVNAADTNNCAMFALNSHLHPITVSRKGSSFNVNILSVT